MGYKYFVQPGRVAFVNYGEDYGKQVVITDIADANRVLIDGENFPRMMFPLKRLSLTKMVVPITRGARTSQVLRVCKKEGLAAKWAAMPAAKKLAQRAARSNLTDLERFQVMVNRRKKAAAVRKQVKVISKKK